MNLTTEEWNILVDAFSDWATTDEELNQANHIINKLRALIAKAGEVDNAPRTD